MNYQNGHAKKKKCESNIHFTEPFSFDLGIGYLRIIRYKPDI